MTFNTNEKPETFSSLIKENPFSTNNSRSTNSLTWRTRKDKGQKAQLDISKRIKKSSEKKIHEYLRKSVSSGVANDLAQAF